MPNKQWWLRVTVKVKNNNDDLQRESPKQTILTYV